MNNNPFDDVEKILFKFNEHVARKFFELTGLGQKEKYELLEELIINSLAEISKTIGPVFNMHPNEWVKHVADSTMLINTLHELDEESRQIIFNKTQKENKDEI